MTLPMKKKIAIAVFGLVGVVGVFFVITRGGVVPYRGSPRTSENYKKGTSKETSTYPLVVPTPDNEVTEDIETPATTTTSTTVTTGDDNKEDDDINDARNDGDGGDNDNQFGNEKEQDEQGEGTGKKEETGKTEETNGGPAEGNEKEEEPNDGPEEETTEETEADSSESSVEEKPTTDPSKPGLEGINLKKKLRELKHSEEKRIVLIGAGPTNLGVLYRFFDLGYSALSNVQIIVLEKEQEAGGLASSFRDSHGFLWDNGGHVVFSHYEYFTHALNVAIDEWNERKRASFAFMKGGDSKRRFIPYPVQNSLQYMDEKFQKICLDGLEEAQKNTSGTIRNFDDWLLKNFGEGLCEIFMRKYNRKVWTVKSTEMNSAWVGERVAVPDINSIKKKIKEYKDNKLEDAAWGPNRMFTFPKYGGTGGIWKGVARLVPESWYHFGHKVVGIDVNKQILKVKKNNEQYSLNYDILINTSPMDLLINMAAQSNNEARKLKKSTDKLIFSHTHVIGLGLKGKPPTMLQDKSWIYFPDSDSPFYRATLFSSYADDNVPNQEIKKYWSLMCEAAQPKADHNTTYWSKDNLIKETIRAMVLYGYIEEHQVVSKYYYQLDHGYPVPSLARDGVINEVQPWLENKSIYSRGRFGGWKYEVGNQDHSFMQGVELADFLTLSVPEETYPDPGFVNAMKATNRTLTIPIKKGLDYELVYYYQNTGLDKILQYAGHTHIYNRGLGVVPDFRFRLWKNLPKVGGLVYGYLYHIVNNYDHLADVTVFKQSVLANSPVKACYLDAQRYVKEAKKNGFSMKSIKPLIISSDLSDGHQRYRAVVKPSKLSLSEYWEYVFGSPMPHNVKWSPSACFGVKRERILRHPKSFYQRMLLSVSHSPYPQEAEYVKKLWVSMFTRDY